MKTQAGNTTGTLSAKQVGKGTKATKPKVAEKQEEKEEDLLTQRLRAAYRRLPKDARAWMWLGHTLPCDLQECGDAGEALGDEMNNDGNLEGYIPDCPDHDFWETVILVMDARYR